VLNRGIQNTFKQNFYDPNGPDRPNSDAKPQTREDLPIGLSSHQKNIMEKYTQPDSTFVIPEKTENSNVVTPMKILTIPSTSGNYKETFDQLRNLNSQQDTPGNSTIEKQRQPRGSMDFPANHNFEKPIMSKSVSKKLNLIDSNKKILASEENLSNKGSNTKNMFFDVERKKDKDISQGDSELEEKFYINVFGNLNKKPQDSKGNLQV
jgi:hypothetical protein